MCMAYGIVNVPDLDLSNKIFYDANFSSGTIKIEIPGVSDKSMLNGVPLRIKVNKDYIGAFSLQVNDLPADSVVSFECDSLVLNKSLITLLRTGTRYDIVSVVPPKLIGDHELLPRHYMLEDPYIRNAEILTVSRSYAPASFVKFNGVYLLFYKKEYAKGDFISVGYNSLISGFSGNGRFIIATDIQGMCTDVQVVGNRLFMITSSTSNSLETPLRLYTSLDACTWQQADGNFLELLQQDGGVDPHMVLEIFDFKGKYVTAQNAGGSNINIIGVSSDGLTWDCLDASSVFGQEAGSYYGYRFLATQDHGYLYDPNYGTLKVTDDLVTWTNPTQNQIQSLSSVTASKHYLWLVYSNTLAYTDGVSIKEMRCDIRTGNTISSFGEPFVWTNNNLLAFEVKQGVLFLCPDSYDLKKPERNYAGNSKHCFIVDVESGTIKRIPLPYSGIPYGQKGNFLYDEESDSIACVGSCVIKGQNYDAIFRIPLSIPSAFVEKPYVIGSYTGDGTASRKIDVGFMPSHVVVFGNQAVSFKTADTDIVLSRNGSYGSYPLPKTCYTAEDGFMVGTSDGYNTSYSTNGNGVKYTYIAYR